MQLRYRLTVVAVATVAFLAASASPAFAGVLTTDEAGGAAAATEGVLIGDAVLLGD